MSLLTVPIFAAAGYVGGTAFHELMHIAAVIGTRSRLEGGTLVPLSVAYRPASAFADAAVKSAPLFALPLVGYVLLTWATTIPELVFAITWLLGLVPRWRREWAAARDVAQTLTRWATPH